eukprot:TRINITY_DN2555_c0_g1_i1.p1 TRINITY_DN2555_c0_g1~~TRINITY_DN2555_c0_g1_i1.p1  ORF type:complete len:155 (-),score=35.43 TRINITY_DN2555_c0_g1_i1:189-653(-)
MSPMKEECYREPIFDNVDPENIFTNTFPVLNIDLKTAKIEDTVWTGQFELTAYHNDYCHALLLYFDAHFSDASKHISLNTGPNHRATHYKQLVLYLRHDLTVCKDEKIVGTLTLKMRQGRDMEIRVDYKFSGANNKPVAESQLFLLPGKKLGKS